MLIASDTSPLVAFSGLGRLDLLHAVFSEVVVPFDVCSEILADGQPWREAEQARELLAEGIWLKLWPGDFVKLNPAPAALSSADIAAVSLARHLRAPCLMDEKKGRSFAKLHGVQVVGTLGVLLRAKLTGFLPALRPVLQALVDQGNFLAADLVTKILREAGEA